VPFRSSSGLVSKGGHALRRSMQNQLVLKAGVRRTRDRVAVIGVLAVLCLALGYEVAASFIVGVLTDERAAVNLEWLREGARYFSQSARLRARLAQAEMIEEERDLDSIAADATLAVNASPWDFNNRVLLATVQEIRGERTEAEKTLRVALTLAPNNTDVKWRLANLLVREGRLTQSIPFFATVASSDPSLLPSTLDLVYRASAGNLAALQAVVSDNSRSKLALAFLLLKQDRVTDAARIFADIDPAARMALPESSTFIDGLVTSGHLELARTLWTSLVTRNATQAGLAAPLIWNGGFESDIVESLRQFDWNLTANSYAKPSVDSQTAHSGSKSLRLDFTGRDTTRLDDEIRQVVVVRPGGRYRLECYAKADALKTPEGPRVVVAAESSSQTIASSDALSSGSNDWRRISVDFSVPEKTSKVLILVRRIPRFSYDDPTSGTVWFDDFDLTEEVHQK
jgi:tetratricopeptide (TPR) repeat protein